MPSSYDWPPHGKTNISLKCVLLQYIINSDKIITAKIFVGSSDVKKKTYLRYLRRFQYKVEWPESALAYAFYDSQTTDRTINEARTQSLKSLWALYIKLCTIYSRTSLHGHQRDSEDCRYNAGVRRIELKSI